MSCMALEIGSFQKIYGLGQTTDNANNINMEAAGGAAVWIGLIVIVKLKHFFSFFFFNYRLIIFWIKGDKKGKNTQLPVSFGYKKELSFCYHFILKGNKRTKLTNKAWIDQQSNICRSTLQSFLELHRMPDTNTTHKHVQSDMICLISGQ